MEVRRGTARRFAIGVCAAVGLLVPIPIGEGAFASVPPAAGCGFTMGAISETGAAGTEGFFATLRPASAFQNCTTAVSVVVDLSPVAAGTTYRNVINDPLNASETVTFQPGRRPPFLGVGWAGHCADPPVPGNLTFTVEGQRATQAIDPTGCTPADGPGSPHSSFAPISIQTDSEVGIAPTASNLGYRTVDQTGALTYEGSASNFGSQAPTNAPIVGVVPTPTGEGDWVVASDGGVFSYGSASYHGSLGGVRLNAPIVGMAATPDAGGYWLVASDGGVFAFGDALFAGSLGATHLNAPVVGIAAAPDGGGYWLVASDGGVFAFGDALFSGSLGNVALNAPVVGMAAGPHGGYWLVASDGGIFTFGGTLFEGSMGRQSLNDPISGMAATSSGAGYWMVGSDNGVFAFGDAGYFGSDPGTGTGIP